MLSERYISFNKIRSYFGILFGAIGGDISRNLEEKIDLNVGALDDNTSSVQENTEAVEVLTQRLINAPASFTIPALATLGGGGGATLAGQEKSTGNSRKYLN